jgi:hypothetical protein
VDSAEWAADLAAAALEEVGSAPALSAQPFPPAGAAREQTES